jgi:hypothetical protein
MPIIYIYIGLFSLARDHVHGYKRGGGGGGGGG